MTHQGLREAQRRIATVDSSEPLDLAGLNLNNEDLLTLQTTLGALASLTELYLDGNQLSSLPEFFGALTSLTRLDLDGNQLSSLPEFFGGLTSLTRLDLDGNQLSSLPESFGALTSLTELYLSRNQLSTLPESFGGLTSLTELYLDGNQLSSLPEFFGALTSLTRLDLDNNQLSSLPESFGALTSLTRLDLNANQLSSLPESFGGLTSLTELYLGRNQLSTLPESFGGLTSLTRLDLDGNQLSTLPESFGALTSLSELDLPDNQLSTLPESFGALTSLSELDLHGNQLSTLPESFGGLSSLTRLYLNANQLSTLPESFGGLTSLIELYLGRNQLSMLPKGLGRLPQLRTVDTIANPLPPEVVAAAVESMDELLRFLILIDAEGVELAEAKLVLVGEGAVGKSSLLAALRGEPWVDNRDQTHGLQIKQVDVTHAGQAITLNGWDFGGQPVYRPAHQLFFTAPAVYMVVWKPREGPELGMVEQWLAMIQHRAGSDARVHVVATHGGASSRVSSIDETRLQERFGPLIVGFHEVDSKVPETLGGLRAAIAETAAALPHSRRQYPASWLKAREELAGVGVQSLSYEDYLQVTGRKGLTATGARSLAINSHALGHWIHYADEPALAQVVILKPDWLSVAIASVLEDKQAGQSGGLVPHRLFGQIWNRPVGGADRPYTHAQQQMFLRMMERFELTYRVPELDAGEPLSLVGQLVPSGRPDLTKVWEAFRPDGPEAVEICQIVEKGTDRLVNPEGLIYRLIVRFHHQAMDRTQAPDGAHWRSGLVVQSRYNARALVTLTPEGVRVQVRGPDPFSYLHQVTDEIRNCVDGFWEGLTTRALLPCQDPCGLGTPGRGLFDRDKLIEARERHRVDFPCNASGCQEYPAIDTLLGAGAPPAPGTDQWGLLARSVENIQARLDELAAGQPSETARILTRLDTLDDDLTAQLHRNDAALTQIMRRLDDEAADGPRLFSLVPIDRTLLRPGWTTQRMRLTLYCEHSRWPVHALDPDHPEAGVYILDVSRDWWVKAVPLLKVTSTLIKPFLGIGLAVTELELTISEWKAVKKQLALGKEVLTAAADFAGSATVTGDWDDDNLDQGGPTGGIMRAEGGVLRTLHATLKERDPTFADLRRVTDAQGRYLWIHPRYLPIYQPPLPEIPT